MVLVSYYHGQIPSLDPNVTIALAYKNRYQGDCVGTIAPHPPPIIRSTEQRYIERLQIQIFLREHAPRSTLL